MCDYFFLLEDVNIDQKLSVVEIITSYVMFHHSNAADQKIMRTDSIFGVSSSSDGLYCRGDRIVSVTLLNDESAT